MDSPIRKQQKRNDYLRHKVFRKIARRKKAEKESVLKAPEKELKRRLKRPRYDDGKNIVYETQNTEDGTVYRVKPSAFGAKELNVTTPEVIVTRTNPRNYRSAFDGNQEYLDDMVSFVPVAGDVNDAINAGIATKNGDYLQAGILGAGLFLPNVLEKPLKAIRKTVGKTVENAIIDKIWLKNRGLGNIAFDIMNDPKRVIKDYINGDYPITFKQRRDFITKKNNFYRDLMDRADEYYDNQIDKMRQRGVSRNDFLKSLVRHRPNIQSSRNTNHKLSLRGADGMYNPFTSTISVPNRRSVISNFNDYKDWENMHTFLHEYTHHLQHSSAGNAFDLNKPSLFTGYYEPTEDLMTRVKYFADKGEYNPFLSLMDAHNVGLISKDRMLYKHSQAPNEAVADMWGYRLTGTGDSKEYYDYMSREYGMSPEDVKMAEQIGYNSGKEELPYPLRTSADYDDNLAYQRGILRDPKTGHMWSTTQEEYPKKRIYLKKPNHPTYSKAVWRDMMGGYDVYRKGDHDYAAPTFSELMYTKPPFRYNSGKDSGIHINPKNRGKFNALKKRTGKTTEQLTHSKNPLTRKRAIFAQNSKKWRKK